MINLIMVMLLISIVMIWGIVNWRAVVLCTVFGVYDYRYFAVGLAFLFVLATSIMWNYVFRGEA